MTPSIDEIINGKPDDPAGVERIAHRIHPSKMEVVAYCAAWPETFERLKNIILDALGSTAVSVEHVGSTSVLGLPAKDVIDIDLTVQDPSDEASYVAQLEAAGFHFLLREPLWNQHRFLCRYEPLTNLHVFGPDSAEPIRHKILRDWLRSHVEDRDQYAATKRFAMDASSQSGENMMQYTERKNDVIHAIIQKALRSLGYIH